MTYDYICKRCAHTWVQTQRITEAPIKRCPKCAGQAAQRLISAPVAFVLKGHGWSADGYR